MFLSLCFLQPHLIWIDLSRKEESEDVSIIMIRALEHAGAVTGEDGINQMSVTVTVSVTPMTRWSHTAHWERTWREEVSLYLY